MADYNSNFTGQEIDERLAQIPSIVSSLDDLAKSIGGKANNRNLLDNWDFRVNQRGQTVYTPVWNGYTVDRWSVEADSDLSVTVLSGGGVTIKNNSTDGRQFKQIIPEELILDGQSYSISCYVVAISGNVSMQLGGVSPPYPAIIGAKTLVVGGNRASGTCTKGTYTGLYKFIITLEGGASATIARCKLGYGNAAYLNNDPPADFGEELRKCQRYFYSSMFSNDGENGAIRAQIWTFGSTSGSAAHYTHGTLFPVTMRAVPAITFYVPLTRKVGKVAYGDSGQEAAATPSAAFLGINGISQVSLYGVDDGLNGNQISYHYTASADL